MDTSVVLSACISGAGASREIFRLAPLNGWVLVSTPYVAAETERNLSEFSPDAKSKWLELRQGLLPMRDVVTLNLPAVFPVRKDRPVLFSALAWADVLLTLDREDFSKLLGGEFYGMAVLKPGDFLERERRAGRLKI
ncbi:MAG: PIN domain-containing protein [Limisphaerales bacterium]